MDDPRIGVVLDDRYQIHGRLAAGGMGIVYRGERVGLAKPVAIKFLHRSAAMMPHRLERFRREGAAMSRLSHPNLVSVIDVGEHDGVPYLVMELHPGTSLRGELDRGALDPRRAVFIAHQMLAGLGSAHDSGVVHRDLKPSNVLLVGAPGEDLVKILDFGIAKLLVDGEGPSELSVVADRVLGTPEYMAPEQARSQPVDARTDIYAVGVILYEMVVGRQPFESENDLAVLRQQVEDAPVPPRMLRSGISGALDAAILRALAKDKDERWQSAHDFAAALAALPEGSGVLALRSRATKPRAAAADPGETARLRPERRWRRLGVLLALLLATAVGAWFAVAQGLVDLPAMPWLSGAAAEPDAAPRRAAPPPAPRPPDAAPPDAQLPDAGPPRDGGVSDAGSVDATVPVDVAR